jgi:hypothetical protein
MGQLAQHVRVSKKRTFASPLVNSPNHGWSGIVWLKVFNVGDGEVKFSWGDAVGPYPIVYTVGIESLKDSAQHVRDALDGLAVWSRARRVQDLPATLRLIADAGSDLRSAVFDAPVDQAAGVAKLQKWLQSKYSNGDKELQVIADPKLHVPWGLVFDGQINDQVNQCSPDAYMGFWSLKHRFSMVLIGCETPELADARPFGNFRLVSLVNEDVYAYAPQDLGEPAYMELDALLAGPAKKVCTLDKLGEVLSQVDSCDKIFHFLGHGTRDALVIGRGQPDVNISRFKKIMFDVAGHAASGSSSYTLVFLNSCESILGKEDLSFKKAAIRDNVCGVIGTEAEVPRPMAMDFDRRLLKSIIRDGRSVGDAMNDLVRDRDLWPTGLFYGCYANSSFRVA